MVIFRIIHNYGYLPYSITMVTFCTAQLWLPSTQHNYGCLLFNTAMVTFHTAQLCMVTFYTAQLRMVTFHTCTNLRVN